MTCTGGVMKPDFGDEKNATKDRYAEEPAWTTRFSSRTRLRQAIWLPLWFAVWMVAALSHMESGQATPASGFTGTTLAQGTFAEFQVMNRLTQDQLQRFAPGFLEIRGLHSKRPRGRQTCTYRPTPGRRVEPLAGIGTPGIA
ncbi:hypothetical protein B0G71_4901 [Paraburkholderia sp. BL27I4N3]|nr:hypothetical protein B0G71_4901 [Paraburkholderia sp. BL27I4N3]